MPEPIDPMCAAPWAAGRRMREMERAGLAVAPEPVVTHWTAARKVGLVVAVAEGFIARLDALARYSLSEEELGSWEARYAAFGRQGLGCRSVQVLRLSPPAAEDAA